MYYFELLNNSSSSLFLRLRSVPLPPPVAKANRRAPPMRLCPVCLKACPPRRLQWTETCLTSQSPLLTWPHHPWTANTRPLNPLCASLPFIGNKWLTTACDLIVWCLCLTRALSCYLVWKLKAWDGCRHGVSCRPDVFESTLARCGRNTPCCRTSPFLPIYLPLSYQQHSDAKHVCFSLSNEHCLTCFWV